MTGLLILTLPYRQLSGVLSQVVRCACDHANKVLYVHLDPAAASFPADRSSAPLSLSQASRLVQSIYRKSSAISSSLDVRVVLAGFKGHSLIPVSTKHPVEKVMVDSCVLENLPIFSSRYCSFLNGNEPLVLLKVEDIQSCFDSDEEKSKIANGGTNGNKSYKNIVAGGTFDGIHVGHKILLSEGLLRCTQKFTIGVTDGPLLEKKTLKELIKPINERISNMQDVLIDIDPSVEYCLEPIYEPLGPSGTDPDMEMIIVSKETLKGGNYVNKHRVERNLNALDVVVIDLIEDTHRNPDEEEKISSSSGRRRLLGTLLKKPVLVNESKSLPYIIGLTGGSASGKSTIAKRLQDEKAFVIDCDRLGHKAYIKGTNCYHKLVDVYGSAILSADQEINRKALGVLVFSDPAKLQQLNELVWPEIRRLVVEQIDELRTAGESEPDIVVLDAAVLLEAGWDQLCHEVWVCLLPRAEACRRICERDHCSTEQADQRLARQMTDSERLARGHVALCSMWQYQETAAQVHRALERVRSTVLHNFKP